MTVVLPIIQPVTVPAVPDTGVTAASSDKGNQPLRGYVFLRGKTVDGRYFPLRGLNEAGARVPLSAKVS